MSTRVRWIAVAVAVLALIGFGVALWVPLGACPDGGTYTTYGDGHAASMTSDVGMPLRP